MKIKNLFWGLFFVLAAAVVIINQLGYFAEINLFSLLFTIFMIPIIITSIAHVNFSGILFPIAFLCIVFAKPLGITDLTPWPVLGAALLGSIGLHFIFGGPKYKTHIYNHTKSHIEDMEQGFTEIVDEPDDNFVDFRVKFGASVKYVNSKNLQKANLSCSFGALKVYFDNTKIHEKGAVINVDVSFGAIELFIPREWNLVNGVNCSLGGIEEKNPRKESGGPTVTLTGNASLAGIEITYV